MSTGLQGHQHFQLRIRADGEHGHPLRRVHPERDERHVHNDDCDDNNDDGDDDDVERDSSCDERHHDTGAAEHDGAA